VFKEAFVDTAQSYSLEDMITCAFAADKAIGVVMHFISNNKQLDKQQGKCFDKVDESRKISLMSHHESQMASPATIRLFHCSDAWLAPISSFHCRIAWQLALIMLWFFIVPYMFWCSEQRMPPYHSTLTSIQHHIEDTKILSLLLLVMHLLA